MNTHTESRIMKYIIPIALFIIGAHFVAEAIALYLPWLIIPALLGIYAAVAVTLYSAVRDPNN
jgi:hypothetical protein